jgi:phenylpropionate dioxygenase-like ring-hydroxylating dioxygenase large terminal subunit
MNQPAETNGWIAELARAHRPGWSLEQPFYTDARIFTADLEQIWKRYWIYVGHTSQLPWPGSYFTFQLDSEPVIIVRGEDGQVRALMNVCRHRGSLLCDGPSGQVKKLVCPYHQWVYDLDGTLRAAKLMPENFNRSEFNLFSLPCKVLEGFIFISFAADPPDFGQLEAAYLPHMQMYDLTSARIAYSATYTVESNWKLIAENFRECYHCGVGHPEYCSVIIGANLERGREQARQVREDQYRAWDARGVPTYRVLFENTGWYYCDRYPYQPGYQTMSMDGRPIAPPFNHLEDTNVGVWSIVQYPNFWLDVNHDYAWAMHLNPKSPTQTEVTASWLVRGDAVEGRDYDLERLLTFWRTTAEQDWKLCSDNQAGVNSSFYRPGPYSDYAEGGPGQFVDWYVAQLAGEAEKAR